MALVTFSTPPPTNLRRFSFKLPESLVNWFKGVQSDKYFVAFFIIWLVTLVLTLTTILATYQSLPFQIPLLYSQTWGEKQLANKSFIFLPVAGSFLLGLFNIVIGLNFQKQDKVVAYLLAGTAGLVSLLSAITVINIIRLMS